MTSPPALAIIAAVARNGVIGVSGGLPWRLPAALRRFRALTEGHAVIMGRRTWESLGRPLPGRQNIVVSRRAGFSADGALVVTSLADALAGVALPAPAFCIGGGELYREALPIADTMYLTEVDRDFEGDTAFPHFALSDWQEIERRTGTVEWTDALAYAFVTYRRRGPHFVRAGDAAGRSSSGQMS